MLISHIRNIFTHCDCYTCTNTTSWDEFMYLTFKEKLFTVLLCFYHFKKHMKTKKRTLVSLEKNTLNLRTLASKDFQNTLWTICYVATWLEPQSHPSQTLQSSEEKMWTHPLIYFLESFDVGLSLGVIQVAWVLFILTDS